MGTIGNGAPWLHGAKHSSLPLLMNPPKSGRLERHVILSEAKDLLKRIEHRKTRSFASLRMTWAFFACTVVHHPFTGARVIPFRMTGPIETSTFRRVHQELSPGLACSRATCRSRASHVM